MPRVSDCTLDKGKGRNVIHCVPGNVMPHYAKVLLPLHMTQNAAAAWNRRGERSDTTWRRNGVTGADPSCIDGAHGARTILKKMRSRALAPNGKGIKRGSGLRKVDVVRDETQVREERDGTVTAKCYENSNNLRDP